MGRSGSAMELSATLLVFLHLSMHVVDEGHAVNPSCTCIRYTSTYGKERGTFSSPDYPRPYPSRIDCLLYTFVAAPHEIVELVFTDFDIHKEHLDCTRGDYLKVYWEVQGPGPPGTINERSAWARELCGSRADAPPALYSPGPSLILEFHSGAKQNNATGFVGTYSFIDRRIFDTDGAHVPGTECDYQFSRSGSRPTHGRLYSPRYPSIYPNNVRCSYHFHARPKERVKIVFEEVALQKGDISCLRRADIIKVFDGRDTNAPAIAMLCNELTGYEVLSTGPALVIQFTANSAMPGQGFAATFLFQPPPDSTAADSDRLLKLSFGKAFESLGPEVSATSSPGCSGVKMLTRKYLFDKMNEQHSLSINEKIKYLENYLLVCYGDTEEHKNVIKKKFSYFKCDLIKRWSRAHRILENCLAANNSWLEGTFEIPVDTHQRPGRPTKSFTESSERTKRRKTEGVRASYDEEVIVHAAQVILQTEGKRNASTVLKDITNSSASASDCKNRHSKSKEIEPLTPLQALTMFVEADLTRRQYEIIRATNKRFYPHYELLLKAKEDCYPPKESLRVTSTCAEGNLQSLLDHTVTRLSLFLEEVLLTLDAVERNSLLFICKWGCDGSQQAQFKQRLSNEDESDANIFISSFVPLRIVCGEDKSKIVWQNPTPSSPRYCRPIRFRFVKESTDITKEEINYVKNSVNSLNLTKVDLNGENFFFQHSFKMTMVDGKVCNAATDTKSTSRCYICGATSKDFNDLTKKNDVRPEALEFGLSVLHARIRIFESVLHLAYKLPVKKYRERRTEEEKNLEKQKKLDIQQRFREETGLLVDMPKSNFGNTNDGNTSRRFFENPELAAEITGISYDLIIRLKVILEAISSGHKIDVAKYDKYAMETAKLYVELYGWHPMTPTMHKVLIHGASIIENSLLPIGQLSEEAAEARNKHFRSYRLNFARKFSREECNLDIYHRLLLTSDPFISSMRKTKKTASKLFLPETMQLLIPAEPNRPMEIDESGENLNVDE